MRYCKECGHHIEFEHGELIGYCPICDKKFIVYILCQHTQGIQESSNLKRCMC